MKTHFKNPRHSPLTAEQLASKVWLLLYQVEQLIIDDPDYIHVIRDVANCLDRVQVIQARIEKSDL